jgi:5-methyltetrahydropteroyltriglutamate--homocysteine methyltransferase
VEIEKPRTEEAYVYALADVMKREYKAIVDAGFILQLDCPATAQLWAKAA